MDKTNLYNYRPLGPANFSILVTFLIDLLKAHAIEER